ncbi:hypothetical protein JCM13664_11640 [Methylothermus subterraneus]
MCLGVPGQVIAISDPSRQLGIVEIGGVRREVNLTCVLEEGEPLEALLGAWVVVHVGFALSRIDEEAAAWLRDHALPE